MDWRKGGVLEMDPSQLIANIDVVDKNTYDAIDDKQQQQLTWWCESALVDESSQPVPLDQTPMHRCDMYPVDLSRLKEVLESKPDLAILKTFLTCFADDFGTY